MSQLDMTAKEGIKAKHDYWKVSVKQL